MVDYGYKVCVCVFVCVFVKAHLLLLVLTVKESVRSDIGRRFDSSCLPMK